MGLKKKLAILMLAVGFVASTCGMVYVRAAEEDFTTHFGVSPMNESIILNPGDNYKGSFSVNNPGYSKEDITYRTEVGPFFVNNDYDPVYENVDGRGELASWTKVTSGATGTLKPNEVKDIEFEIDVPEDAPAGGQYAEISVTVDLSSGEGDEGINIGESMAIGHVILAEITGQSVSSGDIVSMGVDSFTLGGKITAHSTVKNTGNVHGQALYTMKVYPLFSDEVLYSNEDEKDKQYVLPDTEFTNEKIWEETPMVGIFNVKYTVEFMGDTSEVTRMVIVCPWWLLILISMGLILMILRIITLIKLGRKKRAVEL